MCDSGVISFRNVQFYGLCHRLVLQRYHTEDKSIETGSNFEIYVYVVFLED
jgi:hypothetical protein